MGEMDMTILQMGWIQYGKEMSYTLLYICKKNMGHINHEAYKKIIYIYIKTMRNKKTDY